MPPGTAINSAGGTLDAVASLTDSGTLTNLGTINVEQGGTLTLVAATVSNAGVIALSGDAQATLLVESAVILAGGGKVALVGDGNNVISGSSTATLTNAGNTISGAGDIFGLNLVNSGTVNANNPGQTLFVDAARIVNASLLEGTAAGGLFFQGTPTISNTTKGVILASGAGANVALAGVAVYGGTLKTSAAGDIAFVGAGNVLRLGRVIGRSPQPYHQVERILTAAGRGGRMASWPKSIRLTASTKIGGFV